MRRRLITAVAAGLALGAAAAGAAAGQDTLRVQAPALTLTGPEAPATLTVEAPTLTLVGPNEPETLRVAVPTLTLAGPDEPEILRVETPRLILTGPPVHPDIRVRVPTLTLVAAPPPVIIRVDVPGLTLVGPDDQPDTGGLGDTGGPAVNPPSSGSGDGTSDGPARAWCGGDYAVSLSQPRAGAMAMGRPERTRAHVTAYACGARMRIDVDGRAVELTRQADGRYTGAAAGAGGQSLSYTLTCEADFSLTGHMEARDRNIAVRREIDMTPTGGSGGVLAGCSSQAEDDER